MLDTAVCLTKDCLSPTLVQFVLIGLLLVLHVLKKFRNETMNTVLTVLIEFSLSDMNICFPDSVNIVGHPFSLLKIGPVHLE